MEAQLKRGVLEVCVLTALLHQDSYGYKIIKDVSPYLEISESTLYPILKRLEAAGCLRAYSAEHNNRLRRYYQITPLGRERIEAFLGEWNELMKVYHYIKEEIGHGSERIF